MAAGLQDPKARLWSGGQLIVGGILSITITDTIQAFQISPLESV